MPKCTCEVGKYPSLYMGKLEVIKSIQIVAEFSQDLFFSSYFLNKEALFQFIFSPNPI